MLPVWPGSACRDGQADDEIIAQRRHGFQCHVPGSLHRPFIVLLQQERPDDPGLSEPLTAALFPAKDGETAHLVWNRRREG